MDTSPQVFKHHPCSSWCKTTKWHQFLHLNSHLIRWRAFFVVASHWLDLEIESHYRRLQLDNDLSAVSSFFLPRKWFIWMDLPLTDWDVPSGEQCCIDHITQLWPNQHSILLMIIYSFCTWRSMTLEYWLYSQLVKLALVNLYFFVLFFLFFTELPKVLVEDQSFSVRQQNYWSQRNTPKTFWSLLKPSSWLPIMPVVLQHLRLYP